MDGYIYLTENPQIFFNSHVFLCSLQDETSPHDFSCQSSRTAGDDVPLCLILNGNAAVPSTLISISACSVENAVMHNSSLLQVYSFMKNLFMSKDAQRTVCCKLSVCPSLTTVSFKMKSFPRILQTDRV